MTLLKITKRFVFWTLWAGITIVVSQLLVALTLPNRTVGETLKNFSNLRTWELVGLPIMVGGGFLLTLLETIGLIKPRSFTKHRQET